MNRLLVMSTLSLLSVTVAEEISNSSHSIDLMSHKIYDTRLEGRKVCMVRPTRTCAHLLEQGPCPPGQWWVFDRETFLSPACREKRCADPDRYMASDRACHDASYVDTSLCVNSSFFYNFFGEGECTNSCDGPRCFGDDCTLEQLNACDGTNFTIVHAPLPGLSPIGHMKPEGCVENNAGDCVSGVLSQITANQTVIIDYD